MANFIDLTGHRYGMLVVINRADNYEKYSESHKRVLKYAKWLCKCECGNEKEILATDLKSKSQVSCGCHKAKTMAEKQRTHGGRFTKEYAAWLGMKDRCYNVNIKRYEIYGGRGITVCDRWIYSFENFIEDMGKSPSSKHSLDRIDSNGNYGPENCRWATATEQVHNRRRKINPENPYKYVQFIKKIGKYVTLFTYNKVKYTAGYFEEQEVAAKAIYELYKKVTGHYPKYGGDDLIKLGVNNDNKETTYTKD